MEGTVNPIEAAKAQEKLASDCREPLFAPYDGICFACHQNIYDNNRSGTGAITVESASNHLITGCPHCRRSYVD